jgi:hypothetical protein
MCLVFFQFFFYEGRFGEDRDSYRSTRVRVANPKAKAGSHRKTDLNYMMLSPPKKTKVAPTSKPPSFHLTVGISITGSVFWLAHLEQTVTLKKEQLRATAHQLIEQRA